MAASTLVRVASLTYLYPLTTFETVRNETPARRATSRSVAAIVAPSRDPSVQDAPARVMEAHALQRGVRLRSSFERSVHDARHKASSDEEEHDEQWERREERPGHGQPEIDRVALLQRLDGDLHGVVLRRLEHDERPEKVVPAGHESEQPEHEGGGTHDREGDPPEDLPTVCAVDTRGAHELVAHRRRQMLTHPEDPERARETREDHSLKGVDPVERADDHV